MSKNSYVVWPINISKNSYVVWPVLFYGLLNSLSEIYTWDN